MAHTDGSVFDLSRRAVELPQGLLKIVEDRVSSQILVRKLPGIHRNHSTLFIIRFAPTNLLIDIFYASRQRNVMHPRLHPLKEPQPILTGMIKNHRSAVHFHTQTISFRMTRKMKDVLVPGLLQRRERCHETKGHLLDMKRLNVRKTGMLTRTKVPLGDSGVQEKHSILLIPQALLRFGGHGQTDIIINHRTLSCGGTTEDGGGNLLLPRNGIKFLRTRKLAKFLAKHLSLTPVRNA